MKVFILRHGEKEVGDHYWNEGLEQFDPPLTINGKEQSLKLMEYFKCITIDDIYVSQCKRTFETIDPISLNKNIAPIVDGSLNEINTGLFSKMKDEDKKQKYYHEWECLNVTKKDFEYPEGESGKDVLERVKTVFEKLKIKNENAIIATHEGWIKIAICHILGIDPGKRFHFNVDMGSILELDYNQKINYWKIIRMNYVV